MCLINLLNIVMYFTCEFEQSRQMDWRSSELSKSFTHKNKKYELNSVRIWRVKINNDEIEDMGEFKVLKLSIDII